MERLVNDEGEAPLRARPSKDRWSLLPDWARRQALPAEEEIDALRRLIDACEGALAQLDPADRAAVEEAIEFLRKGRAGLDTTFPVQFRGMVAQPAPALFPAVAAEAGRGR